ncbi:Zinc finger protein [Pseudolycoriella hygida]|uniref:Zinc finger protein n=1 Tax=Pseudolycoriella hygida TaxID=35572 RepID=A0A9Q0MKL7_9DIPT|nr:Zinc finger protein [Pseudolycoriella hygida]
MDPLQPLLCGDGDNRPSQKFGEIYCNYMGVLTFHCVLCPQQMNYDEYIFHYMIHFRDLFEIKQEVQEEDSELLAPNSIDEPLIPVLEEVKLEMPKVSATNLNEIKTEPWNSDDSCTSMEHFTDDLDPPATEKRGRGRPKNSINFTEPKECGICGETFLLRRAFKEHVRVHQCGATPAFFECEICGRKATKLKNLEDHFRAKHSGRIKCEICRKMIRRHYKKCHMKRHSNERNFKCMLCDRAFVLHGDLTTHLKQHNSGPPVKAPSSKKFDEPKTCTTCGQKFIGICAFERHMQSHGATQSLYECDICGRKVKEKKNLISHMIYRHSGIPKMKVPCKICGKIFTRKYLNLHVRKHNLLNQQPSHMCPICGKTFLVSGDLSAHIRQHNRTAEAVPCNICGKLLASQASLADHNRVHSGERPFPCQVCGSTFRTRSMLYVHKTIHLTEKNFSCDICHLAFKNPAYVKTHKRKVHEKNKVPKKIR